MATGDKVCPNCGQWQVHCQCGQAAARQREAWAPETIQVKVDWSKPQTYTMDGPPPGGWLSSITTETRKPRKRRHFRQEVYR